MKPALLLAALLTPLTLLWASFAPTAEEPPPERPHILFLFADDQRPDTVAAWGKPHIETPSLDAMAANDAEAFFDAVARDGDARHVCGTAPIYLTLRLGDTEGELLKYGQGRIHPESGSVVSYAAVAFR